MTAGEQPWEGGAGELLVLPAARRAVVALEDATVLLTVATGA